MKKFLLVLLFIYSSSFVLPNVYGETEEENKDQVLREYEERKSEDQEFREIEQMSKDIQDLSPINVEQATSNQEPYIGDGKIKDSYLSTMMNGMMKEMISKYLKENPFSKIPRDEVRSMIKIQTESLPVGKVFEKNPKLLEVFTDWLRDQVAIPKLVGIVNKPEQVKIYGIVVIAVFIISFIFNLLNNKGNLFQRILKKLFIVFCAFTVNLAVFYFLFQPNVKPTLDIILKYYHL